MKRLAIKTKHLAVLVISAFLLFPSVAVMAQQQSEGIEQQVENYLSRMTLDEKIAVIHAQSKFSARGVPRLGLPDFWTDDGPHGVRPDVLWDEWEQAGQTNDSCVAFPALTCLAATWNPSLAHLYGKSLGEEALYRGKDMILGPGVNIYRTPLNGRNFEYLGEDRPQLRVLRRRPVSLVHNGCALYTRYAGEWGSGLCEALCTEQR